MSGAPVRKDNGGALAKFIVSAVLFVLGFVGVILTSVIFIGEMSLYGNGGIIFTMDQGPAVIVSIILMLVITVLFLISGIMLSSGLKALSRARKGNVNAYGGGKVSAMIILGNIFIGIGFYVFMFINKMSEFMCAVLFGMDPFGNPIGVIKTICLILFIVGIVLLLLGIVLALVCYKKAASAYGDDSYIPLSSYATKPMNDVGYDAASVGYDPNGGYMPQDNFDQLPVNGQPDPMFTDPQPQPQPQPNPADFQNFEPSSIPNYAQDGVYNVPNNNPMPEFEPKSISQFDNVPANNAPAADAYNPGYNAAPAQNAYNPGYNAVPDQNAYNAGYNAAPAQNGYNPGYNAAPVQNAYDPNYNAYPAPAADSGPRLKSTFKAPRNPDGSSYNIPSSAMNQEYTKPHESFKSAGDL